MHHQPKEKKVNVGSTWARIIIEFYTKLSIGKWKLHFVCEVKKNAKFDELPCFVIEFYTNYNCCCCCRRNRSESTSQPRACWNYSFVNEKSNGKLLHFWHDHCWLVWMQQYLNTRCNLIKNSISILVWIFKMYSQKTKRTQNKNEMIICFLIAATWLSLYSNKHTSAPFDRLEDCKKHSRNKKWTCKLLFFSLDRRMHRCICACSFCV